LHVNALTDNKAQAEKRAEKEYIKPCPFEVHHCLAFLFVFAHSQLAKKFYVLLKSVHEIK